MIRTYSILWAMTCFACLPLSAWATGVPNGPEFQANVHTTDDQRAPRVSSDGADGFVIVWESTGGQDGQLGGVFGQRFDSAWNPTVEFQVNTYTTENQSVGGVAPLAGGGFAVVWQSGEFIPGENLTGVFGRCYDAAGAPLGAEFHINSFTTGRQSLTRVGSTSDGGFVVAWNSDGQPPSAYQGIFGQEYDSNCAAVGGEHPISETTTADRREPEVSAACASGDSLVVWEGADQDADGSAAVVARRFDPGIGPVGTEFVVNTYTTGDQSNAAVWSGAGAQAVVVWQSSEHPGDTSGLSVVAQRLDCGGAKLGTEFVVNSYTTGDQTGAQVSSDGNGGFVITWLSQDGASLGTFGQRYSTLGAPVGGELAVNSYTTSARITEGVIADGAGGFTAVFHADLPGEDQLGVFAQRFTNCGNGSKEGDEECDDGNLDSRDGCDDVCQIEKWFCCDDETESCNSDAACTTGPCCGPGRCNVEGIVAVCDALGAPCATNTDCGAEVCCDDDPCGNGLAVDDEECDAGVSGCNPDAPGQCCESQCDSATCLLLGQCTDTGDCCRDANGCGVGVGCCGDGTVDAGESCDDGNLDNGDCCSSTCAVPAGCLPACPGIVGAHLLQAASMKAKFDDKNKDDPAKDGDGKYERWKIGKRGQNGDFNLDAGQHTDCRSEEMEVSFIENNGSDGVRELGSFTIPAAVWDKKKPTLLDDGSVKADDQCKLSDKTEMKSVPPGVSKAQWREKGVKVKYRFQGKLLGEIEQPTSFVEPLPGEDPEGQIRVCVRVGASAGHSVLSCTLRKAGEQLKCQSDN